MILDSGFGQASCISLVYKHICISVVTFILITPLFHQFHPTVQHITLPDLKPETCEEHASQYHSGIYNWLPYTTLASIWPESPIVDPTIKSETVGPEVMNWGNKMLDSVSWILMQYSELVMRGERLVVLHHSFAGLAMHFPHFIWKTTSYFVFLICAPIPPPLIFWCSPMFLFILLVNDDLLDYFTVDQQSEYW